MTYNDITQNEKAISGALALVMHLLFLVLLVVGVSWQKKQADAVAIVDLWSELPALQPQAETPPPPEVKPEPPQPLPKVETKPPPKPETKPVVKPDIALKEKLEKERKQKEQDKAEAKKREDEKSRAALKEKRAKEAEAKRLAKEQDDAIRKMNAQAAAQAAAQAKLMNEYTDRIRAKIRRFIVEPPNLQGNPEVQFEVVQLPGGEVLGVKLRHTSGVPAYDNAVERAILKAQPLPPPPQGVEFNEVRELTLKIRPKQ